MYLKLEYGSFCANSSIYIYNEKLSDDQLMLSAFAIDSELRKFLHLEDGEQLELLFIQLWAVVLIILFGCRIIKKPKKEYEIIDYFPLIDCGDAGPDINEIETELLHPYGFTMKNIESIVRENIKAILNKGSA